MQSYIKHPGGEKHACRATSSYNAGNKIAHTMKMGAAAVGVDKKPARLASHESLLQRLAD
jgi:hypothetical protein